MRYKEDRLKEYKKVALRFLKESGFYNAWMQYLRTKQGKYFLDGRRWYDREDVISIFGATRFGDYLNEKGIAYLPEGVYHYFRTYVELYYPYVFDNVRYDMRHKWDKTRVTETKLFERIPQLKRE